MSDGLNVRILAYLYVDEIVAPDDIHITTLLGIGEPSYDLDHDKWVFPIPNNDKVTTDRIIVRWWTANPSLMATAFTEIQVYGHVDLDVNANIDVCDGFEVVTPVQPFYAELVAIGF